MKNFKEEFTKILTQGMIELKLIPLETPPNNHSLFRCSTKYGVVLQTLHNLKTGKTPTIKSSENKTEFFTNQLKEVNNEFFNFFEVVEYINCHNVIIKSIYGEIRATAKNLIRGFKPSIQTALNKKEYYLNKLKHVNPDFLKEYTLISDYTKESDYGVFRCKYGDVKITFNNSYTYIPNIMSAINKTEFFLKKLEEAVPDYKDKFEVVSEYVKSLDYMIVRDKYGELRITAGQLLQGHTPNVSSALDRFSYRVNQFREVHCDNYTYIKDESYPEGIKIKCNNCSREFKQKIDNHLIGKGCNTCSTKRAAEKQAMSYQDFLYNSKKNGNINVDFTDCGYISLKFPVKLKCTLHNEVFTQTASSCRYGMVGCPSCKRNNLGFLKDSFINSCRGKTALLYILKINNENEIFYKIGVTNRSVKKRFERKVEMPYNYEIIYTKEDKECPGCIYDSEVNLLNKYNIYKYQPKIKFNGYTECFTTELPIEEIITHLNNNLP
jgi:Zn finger protein HypA/HybF involved in hydrogenase expression